jgi:ketosteroid isomerase-like protein
MLIGTSPLVEAQGMNRTMGFFLLVLALGLTLSATPAGSGAEQPGHPASPQAAIEVLLKSQQAAWNNGDVDEFMHGYWNSPQLSFAGSAGLTRGYAMVLAHYKQSYPNRAAMGQLEFTDLEVRALGDNAALVLGKWHLERQTGKLGGVFSLVCQRFSDGWKIVHDHTSQSAEEHP